MAPSKGPTVWLRNELNPSLRQVSDWATLTPILIGIPTLRLVCEGDQV